MKPETQTEQTEPAIDSRFLAILQQHRRGMALSDLSQGLREVAEAVQLTGKGGSITFKVTLTPASKSAAGALVIEDEIKLKVPKVPLPGSIFFVDADGNLLREDPNQMKLGLRILSAPADEQPEALRKVVNV